MAPFDFPANPMTGQNVLGANGCTYTWDGVKWTGATGASPPIAEAPNDGQSYARNGLAHSWVPALLQSAGPFLPLSGGTMTGGLNYTATGGTISRSAQDRAADVANVLDYGADPTNTNDSTTAIRGAIATGRTVYVPKGNYLITDLLTLNNGQQLYGDGRTVSVLYAYGPTYAHPFNLSALGVVRLATSETGASLRDVGIIFQQPDQSVRANLVAFPPAIYAQNAPRFQIVRVRVSGAMVGLDARGNSGGAFIDDFECGAFNAGMMWDGSRDVVHIKDYHFYNFGAAVGTGLGNIYQDGTTLCASVGRVDGFWATNFFSWYGGLTFTANCTTATTMANVALDGAAMIINGNANYRFSNVSMDVVPGALLTITNGFVKITNLTLYNTPTTGPTVVISGSATEVSIIGGEISHSAASITAIALSAGKLSLVGLKLTAGGVITAPFIAQTGGDLAMSANFFSSGSTGVGISIAADSVGHHIENTTLYNMTMALPASPRPLLGNYGFHAPSAIGDQVPNIGRFTALTVDQSAGTNARQVTFGSTVSGNASSRWQLGANAVGEGGSNAGSNFFLQRFDDTGTSIDVPMTVNRASGQFQFADGIGLGSATDSSATDVSKHLQIYGTTNGIGFTVGQMNYNTDTGVAHAFRVAGATIGLFTSTGLNTCVIGATTPVTATFTFITINAGGPNIRSGTGAATGTQPKGSIWLRTDGAAGTTLYVSQGAGTWNAVAGV